MKLFFAIFFLTFSFVATAQPCSRHALMRQGTRLEYNVTMPGVMNRKPVELNMTINVDRVVDSAGIFYSEIVKEGIGRNVPKDSYRSRYTLECDGKNIMIPFDFYNTDTIFQSDVFDFNRSRGWYSAAAPLKDNFFSYIIPLSLEGIRALPESDVKVVKQEGTVRGMEGGRKTKMTVYWKMLSVTVAGKEKITTAAGSFDCFKVLAKCEVELNKNIPIMIVMHINDELGLVRSRTQSEFPMAETELVKVKK